MTIPDRLVDLLIAELDDVERAGGVAYYAEPVVAAGSNVAVPGLDLEAPWEGLLGFVDREPTANWAHSCRYVLINTATREVVSIEAKVPPFGPADDRRWRVAYKAPSVPEAAVANPD